MVNSQLSLSTLYNEHNPALTSIFSALSIYVPTAALFTAILLTLLAIDPMVTIVTMIVFGAAYGIVTWLTRHRLVRNSQYIAHEQTQVIKALQEGLGGIRDVLLEGAQTVYCDIYRKAVQRLQWAWGENTYITQAPRYAMETLGMVLIAALAYSLTHRTGGIGAALPVFRGTGAWRTTPTSSDAAVIW